MCAPADADERERERQRERERERERRKNKLKSAIIRAYGIWDALNFNHIIIICCMYKSRWAAFPWLRTGPGERVDGSSLSVSAKSPTHRDTCSLTCHHPALNRSKDPVSNDQNDLDLVLDVRFSGVFHLSESLSNVFASSTPVK